MSNRTVALVRRLSVGLGETRRELGLSRESIAQMAGVSRSTVENVELGKASPQSTVRVALALVAYTMFAPPPAPTLEDEVVARLIQPERRLLAVRGGDAA